ncbi:MAG: AMP-binding protein [Syntrophobacterales bacterium]|nr:AMP-binding protein [Syntrophobacterales bacterium]
MNYAEILQSKFRDYSAKQAIIFDEEILTYEELNRTVNRVSEFLKRKGVKKGDRVAIQLSKCLEIIYFHLACLASGAIALHLNDTYTSAETEYFIRDSGSSLFVTDSENYLKSEKMLHGVPGLKIVTLNEKFPGALFYPEEMGEIKSCPEPPYSGRNGDTAMILYTSGTTGKSKGAMISHRSLIENMADLHEIWELSDHDISLHTLPLVHGHGLVLAAIGALYAGMTTIMCKKFDPECVWDTIEKEHCTLFMGVPTMYQRMLNVWEQLPQKPDISSMRLFTCGSAPLSGDLFDRFNNAVGHTILERYGLTETLVIASNPYRGVRKAKSVGYPLPCVSVRIVGQDGIDVIPGEVGEFWVKSSGVFNGYWRDPEGTEESFCGEWFKTGDLGYQDPRDNLRLYLVGRSKEMIISGGYNVYPKEVENRLEQHKAVKEAAIVALPDPDFGEKVTAAVVFENHAHAGEAELLDFCKSGLAGYKCPKKIYVVNELPRNAMGKILKDEIKKML